MSEYPLLRLPAPEPRDPRRPTGFDSDPRTVARGRQQQRFGPQFDRLRNALRPDQIPLLRADPASIAPERALVLEVYESVEDFYRAIIRVEGLEFLGEAEAEFEPDEYVYAEDAQGQVREDKSISGCIYLAMPDVRALKEMLSLWDRWCSGTELPRNFGRWGKVFERLRDVRGWGPVDRIAEDAIGFWREEFAAGGANKRRIEAELWFYRDTQSRSAAYAQFEKAVTNASGRIIDHAIVEDIGYEAALLELPSAEVERLISREEVHLAVCDEVMFLRPQSALNVPAHDGQGEAASKTSLAVPVQDAPPIAALFDGVPVQNHQLLMDRIDVDDPDNLENLSVVESRRHGTAMASLIMYGDLENLSEAPIARKLHIRPILYASEESSDERFFQDRLLVDVFYRAVRRMKEGEADGEPTAAEIFLVNLSLGDLSRPFSGLASPWARLVDYLADRYGILFLVSAGNVRRPLPVKGFSGPASFEDASEDIRSSKILMALDQQKSMRTLLSPAEAINAITVGAQHEDSFTGYRGVSAVDPYGPEKYPNISSALGLGLRKTIKPDIHMPGGREHVRPVSSSRNLVEVVPWGQNGMLAAAPGSGGDADRRDLSNGTSAATALATRAAHRIFEVLKNMDSDSMHAKIESDFYAVIIKALLVHHAQWEDCGRMLKDLYGPHGPGKYVEQRDNIARVLGYGFPDIEKTIVCASHRATLVGYGTVHAERANVHRIPLPSSLKGVSEPRSITMTVAWFSPINPYHREYRRAKLEVDIVTNADFRTGEKVTQEKVIQKTMGAQREPDQPSDRSTPRGTVFHTRYRGKKAVEYIDDGYVLLRVTCKERAGGLDQAIRYGVAVTVEAGESVPVYEEIQNRLAVAVGQAPRA